MNRSSKGFGLAGVAATVVVLIVVAIFSASARSNALSLGNFPACENAPFQVSA